MRTAPTTAGGSKTESGWLPAPGDGPARTLALACSLGLAASYVAVLYGVTAVVGGTRWLAVGVGGALLLATVLARFLPVRAGLAVGGALLCCGFVGYILLIPNVYYGLFTLDRLVADLLAMVGGRSVVLFLRADLWAVCVAPGPAFLGWYLALRRRYDLAALVGTAALGFFVLTSDAGGTVTLAGTAAALGLLGFGAIERSAADWQRVADLGLAVALAVVAARFLRVVPEGSAGVAALGGPGGPTTEGELVDAGEQVSIQGSVSLSPTRRFTIAADRPGLWHAGAYDRYTGGGWARAGGSSPYGGPQSTPPGGSETVRQRVRVEATVSTMPVAWKPVLLDPTVRRSTRVTSMGGLEPADPFEAGDEYDVLSRVPNWTDSGLREAGTDYPSGIAERFRQLPRTLPDRFFETAAAITEGAETPYEKAVAVQRWLVENKRYSLEVRRPDHDIADAFVHDMNRGYCTYFATGMAALLRAVDVPARFAVGYLPGEEVADGEWAVRGHDSHAWVEVYFPTVGWVAFDPTPGAARASARGERADAAGDGAEPTVAGERGQQAGDGAAAGGEDGAGSTATATTDRSAPDEPDDGGLPGTPPGSAPDPLSSLGRDGPVAVEATATTESQSGSDRITAAGDGLANVSGDADGDRAVGTPDGRDRLSAMVALGGVLLGAYRLGLLERAAREVWLRYLPRTESAHADVRRAYDRLEFYLQTRYREREPGETPREFLDDLADRTADERIRRIGAIHQQSRYGDRVTRSAADEAIRLVETVVRGK